MKNRLRGLGNKKQIEIAAMAETFEHEGQQLRKVERMARVGDYVKFSNQVDGNSLVDGVIYGPIKECGNGSLIVKGYNVYQKEHNRTTFTVEVFEVLDSVVATSKILEKINNVDFYLTIESNYVDPTEGRGKQDAVLFQMSQVAEGKEEIDSCVIVSVDAARSFAEAILKTCDEIGREEPRQEIYYFTFGAGHNLDGYVLPIIADSPDAAREKMFDLYGKQWSFQYTAVEWQQSLADGYFKTVKMLPKVFYIQESEGK